MMRTCDAEERFVICHLDVDEMYWKEVDQDL